MRISTARGILAGLALALSASASLAADADAVGSRLKEVLAGASVPMTYASAEAAGENVVLRNVAIGPAGDAAPLGDVTLENVTGSNAEGWKIGGVAIKDVDTTGPTGKKVSIKGMSVDGLLLAAKDKPSTLPGQASYFFDSMKLDSANVANGDTPVFTLGETALRNTVSAGDGTITSAFDLGDFTLDFAATGDAQMAGTMQAIGYPTIKGDGAFESVWNPATGETRLTPFRVTVANAGELDVSYDLRGYTPAFARSLAEIQQQMASNPENSQSNGMAILGLLSQLSIGGLEIDFTDNSLTGKLLDYYAAQNGTTRAQLVDGISQIVPQSLAGLNNPGFQSEVSNAVSTFLKDPQSLSIAISPDNPIPATQVVGAAMGAPQTLPDVLKLKVTANEATDGEEPATDTPAPAQPNGAAPANP